MIVRVRWDTTSDDDQGPVSVENPVLVPTDVVAARRAGDEDAVSEYLSARTGWCVLDWSDVASAPAADAGHGRAATRAPTDAG